MKQRSGAARIAEILLVFLFLAEAAPVPAVTGGSISGTAIGYSNYNVFNHAQFYGSASVDGKVNVPNFGQVVTAAGPRLIQSAFMFNFSAWILFDGLDGGASDMTVPQNGMTVTEKKTWRKVRLAC